MKARRFTRYPTDVPFSLSIEGMVGKHQYYLKDAGQGGLCFDFLGCIDLGTSLNISISLSNELRNTTARVAWCEPLAKGYCSMGVVFDEAVTQAAIEKVLLTHQY